MGTRDNQAQGRSHDSAVSFVNQLAPFTQLVDTKAYHQIIETVENVSRGVDDPALKALFSVVQQLCVMCEQSETAVSQQRDLLAQAVASQASYQKLLGNLLVQLPSLPVATVAVAGRSIAVSKQHVVQQLVPSPESDAPTLVAYLFGSLRLYQNEQPIDNWPNGKGRSILKYLLLHRHKPVPKEVLMEQFWPEATADSARNNLNVAIYGLRKALRDEEDAFSHVIFQNNAYQLNPEMTIWVDTEAFTLQVREAERLEAAGEWETAVSVYQAAESLYQGDFLVEDRYEDWIETQRHQLQQQYMQVLEKLSHYYFENHLYSQCITTCKKILAIDSCCEEAHRWLMSSYYQQGQRNLALRQYHYCQTALADDLAVEPMPETIDLYELIRNA